MRFAGVLLVVLGLLALIQKGFTYTEREKVIDAGPLHASVDRKKHVDIAPAAGGTALAVGALILLTGKRGE